MSSYPNLSESDYAVMEILWRDGESDSSEISKELYDVFGWSRQTVGTYLKRLVDKGLVSTKKKNKRDFIYFPIVSKEQYGTDITSSYLNRYFHSLSHMVSGLMQNEDLSSQEIENLEQIIENYKSQKKGGNDV